MPLPQVIALTGGLCSGKSAVARWLRDQGFAVLDLDQVARDVVAPGQPALSAIVETFGNAVLKPDGTLNRARLRQIVFSDDQARQRLEAITHPAIHEAVEAWLKQQTAPVVFVEIPLLAEKGRPDYVDEVWVVASDEPVRRARCRQRGVDDETFERILAVQATDAQRQAVADTIIDNGSEWEQTQAQLERLISELPPG